MYKKDKLALKINEYVETNGTDTVMDNDEILLLADLEDAGLKATDYCYNYVNSRIASKYDAVPLFLRKIRTVSVNNILQDSNKSFSLSVDYNNRKYEDKIFTVNTEERVSH